VSARPKLREDLVLVEQTYRGEQSFILKDPKSRKYFRFRRVEVMVMQALDGSHSATDAAAALAREGLSVSPASVEAFANRLSGMGLCERTLSERSVLEMERLRAERRRRLGRGLGPLKGDLLRMRWSVGDPDKLLDRLLPRLRFFFTPAFLKISVALFAVYFLVLALKWPDFVATLWDFYNLNVDLTTFAVFWLAGTVIIVIHELGHGLTCKYFGGQVHEIGAMLIYFELAFFCNVNDAWTFPERRARLWVTAAGSWIQLVVASIAAIVWWAATPGTVLADAAFAGVFIGGITTVFMNANPLLPLDGYYALSDYLEIPNLRKRAFAHLTWLAKSRLFRLDLPAPPANERERRVFLIYGCLASLYVTIVLTFFAATAFGWLNRWLGVVGIAIFLTGAFLTLRQPVKALLRTAKAAFRQHRAAWGGQPWKRRLIIGAPAILVLGAIVPWRITVVGPFRVAPVLSIPHTAPDSGVIERVLVREGTRIISGSPLLQIRNLELERELLATRRTSDSLAMLSAQARGLGSQSEVALLDTHRAVEDARLAGLQERVEALRIRALGNGIVVTPRPEELVGRWVSNGETVMLLGHPDSVEIRIALAGAGATLVRPGAPVDMLPEATLNAPASGLVAAISVAASRPETIEARLRVPAAGAWRPGMTGRASVTLRRSNAWGALWWSIRRGIRSDILL
jgi:putative peptide zinc metalloprotease protein